MDAKNTKNQNFSGLKHISAYLSTVEDFRMEKKCLHKLSDILFIGLLTFFKQRRRLRRHGPVRKYPP